MYQLRNLINQTAVPSGPAHNMKVAEDFFLLLHAHIVSAARVLLSWGIPASVSILAKTIVGTYSAMTNRTQFLVLEM